ncbi:MAG: type II toxin-antitoxin system Phd/YefM family antitoxin [Tepidisphaeraceae bacterium]
MAMLKIKPEFWTRNGRDRFVVLSLDDFEKVQELIEDAGLSRILRRAKRKEANARTIPLREVKRKLRTRNGSSVNSR